MTDNKNQAAMSAAEADALHKMQAMQRNSLRCLAYIYYRTVSGGIRSFGAPVDYCAWGDQPIDLLRALAAINNRSVLSDGILIEQTIVVAPCVRSLGSDWLVTHAIGSDGLASNYTAWADTGPVLHNPAKITATGDYTHNQTDQMPKKQALFSVNRQKCDISH